MTTTQTWTQQAATDRRWRLTWAAWVGAFAVAEWAAVRSGNPKAPLSYFLRTSLGVSVSYHPVHRKVGQVVAGGAIVWLVVHLYNEGSLE
jgi:hypothetical protein